MRRCEHVKTVHEDPYIGQNMKGARIADDGETMMIGVCVCVVKYDFQDGPI